MFILFKIAFFAVKLTFIIFFNHMLILIVSKCQYPQVLKKSMYHILWLDETANF